LQRFHAKIPVKILVKPFITTGENSSGKSAEVLKTAPTQIQTQVVSKFNQIALQNFGMDEKNLTS